MPYTPLSFRAPESVTIADLESLVDGWMLDNEYRQLSLQTISGRRIVTSKLLWWLRTTGRQLCGVAELRAFLAYVASPHPDGRWGIPGEIQRNKPATVASYHSRLKALFSWAANEGETTDNIMARIKPPSIHADQIQPLSADQLRSLIGATRTSDHRIRDEAIVLFLVDTLCRVSEVVDIRMTDVDLRERQASVRGKGGKHRMVYWSPTTGKAIWRMLRGNARVDTDPLFESERGGPMTRSGVQQMIERMGRVAGISGVRCSPHTLRHTGAVMLVRDGANVFALQQLLGHTTLHMTRRYVALADADLRDQHMLHSPVEKLGRRIR